MPNTKNFFICGALVKGWPEKRCSQDRRRKEESQRQLNGREMDLRPFDGDQK